MSAPALRATVADIVRHRNEALTGYARAHDALLVAQETFAAAHASERAAGGGVLSSFNDHQRRPGAEKIDLHLRAPDRVDFMDLARRHVDTSAWSHVIQLVDLERLMDRKAKEELRKSLMENPPEITEDNIRATVENFMLEANTIFQRGIAVCFSSLDKRFKSHDGWKVGARAILTFCFNNWGSWNYHGNDRDYLFDVERTFLVLDGKPPVAGYQSDLVAAIEASRKGVNGPVQSLAETEYFRARCFQNGNIHLWFKRDDLVERVNRLLGEYYGAPIPEERTDASRAPDPFSNRKVAPAAKDFAFFPTPDAVADRAIEAASLYVGHDERLVCLEPSAGLGALSTRMAERGHVVDCIELKHERAQELRASRRYRSVECRDFLTVEPVARYDRVVMNPPFDRERDIDHVVHALEFLKPGGRLVAVMSAGTEVRETKKSAAFRDLVAKHNGSFWDLPAGSFSSVGTNCNTVLLNLRSTP